jgi:HD-like signal output (HDOD) protein
MTKPRQLLTAAELPALEASLDRALDRVGVVSQPEVVLRLLNLCNDPDSQLLEFARVIKSDPAIAGRVMKLANSALFAQRSAVTSLERACLVLGLERLKSVSLGFHMSRAVAGVGSKDVSRRVWTHSVFRACFAAELARMSAPSLVPEAFITGLMLDAGIPLMSAIKGTPYDTLYRANKRPSDLFQAENQTLEFTHIDAVAALARRWRFPDLLSRPMIHRHTRPISSSRQDAGVRLQRVAYFAGALEIADSTQNSADPAKPSKTFNTDTTTPMPTQASMPDATARAVLGLDAERIAMVVSRCTAEYQAQLSIFSDLAGRLGSADDIRRRVQLALVQAADSLVESDLRRVQASAPLRLALGTHTIELQRQPDGSAQAFLYDPSGRQLLTHTFHPAKSSPSAILAGLGLGVTDPNIITTLAQGMQQLAA